MSLDSQWTWYSSQSRQGAKFLGDGIGSLLGLLLRGRVLAGGRLWGRRGLGFQDRKAGSGRLPELRGGIVTSVLSVFPSMSKHALTLVLMSLLASGLSGFQAGNELRARTLTKASRQVYVDIGLNRAEFFTGEEVIASVRLTNPGSSATEIPDPGPGDQGHLTLIRYRAVGDGPDGARLELDGPSSPLNVQGDSRVARLGAGQAHSITVNLSDPRCFDRFYRGASLRCLDTFVPGRYALKPWPGRSTPDQPSEAVYSVVEPRVYLWDRATRMWHGCRSILSSREPRLSRSPRTGVPCSGSRRARWKAP